MKIPAKQLRSAVPVSIGTSNSKGTGGDTDAVALSDHIHDHGAQTDGTHHAVAIPDGTAGFLSGPDKAKLDGIAANADVTIDALAAAEADIDVNGNRITNVADPTAPQDAATKLYVDSQSAGDAVAALANASTSISVNDQRITNLADPTSAQDSATKAYVDSAGASAVVAGAGLTKSGSTLAVGTNADGSIVVNADDVQVGVISDAQHGSLSGGSLHATATESADGFISAADQAKLNTVATSAAALTSTTPQPVRVQAANAGSATLAARADHLHSIITGSPVEVGASNADGVATSVSRSDHVHAHGTQTDGTMHADAVASGASGFMTGADKAKLDGVSANADVTPLSSSTPAPIAQTAVIGTASTVARADHVHAHGSQTDGTQHAPATAGGASGFITGTDQAKLDNIAANADVTLSALASASTNVSVNNKRITGLADPTSAQDAATKAYVDAISQSLDIKASCRVATTGSVSLSAAPNTVDGVTLAANDRVLVKDQGSAENGIYTVTSVGTGANGIWARATDADTSAKVSAGLFTFVSEGTLNGDIGWVLVTNDPIVLNTTVLTFSAFSGASQIIAGAGLTKSGNVLNAAANVDGSIVVNADDIQVGVISDAQHGARGGGSLHSAATTTVAGFLSAADKVRLDSMSTGADVTPLSSSAPLAVALTASAGSDTNVSRADHVHAHGVQTDGSLHASAIAGGASGFLTGSDKAKLDGVAAGATNLALAATTPEPIGTATAGTGTTAAKSDHVHAHGVQAGGALHAAATTSTAGFIAAADKTKLDGISALADVTLTALASSPSNIAVNSKKITGLADPTSAQDAATKNYVDANTPAVTAANVISALASAASDIAVNSHKITGVADPTNAQDAATKAYVDGAQIVAGTSLSKTGNTLNVTTIADSQIVGMAASKLSGTVADAQIAALAASKLTGTISDAQHGGRAGGTLHAQVTTSVDGFMIAADKSKLDGIASGATAGPALASTTPAAVGTGAVGVGTTAARSDHVHDHGTQTDGTMHAAAIASGASGFLTGADKSKLDGIATGATSTPLATTTPASIGTAAVGVGTTAARSDHVHAHGTQAGGTLHAQVTTSVDGFMIAADKSKLDGVASGATATPLASTTPAAVGTGAVGVGTTAARADHVHDHGNQAGGSLHATATGSVAGFISSTDQTKLNSVSSNADNTLTALAATASDIAVNTHKITGLLDPTNPQDAATKAYVDAAVLGMDLKTPCRVATTTNPGNVASTAPSVVDGVSVAVGDRVLIKDGNARNGIWTVTTVGTGANGVWTRATDADNSGITSEVTNGLFVFVLEGTVNANTGWLLTTPDPITLGTTLTTFTQMDGPGSMLAGAGLTRSGNTFSIGAAAISDSMIAAMAASKLTGTVADSQIASVSASKVTGSIIDSQIAALAANKLTGTISDAQHGSRGSGSLHAQVTTSVDGFMIAADKSKLDGIAISATATPLSSTTPAAVGTGAVGVGTTAARADHVHDHGNQAGGSLHAVATSSVNGFMSSADKVAHDAMTSSVKSYCTYAATGNIADLAAGAPLTVDGLTVSNLQRILVAGQTTVSQNGIYTVTAAGSGSNGQWTLATDADTTAKIGTGVLVWVGNGSSYANTLWVISGNPSQYTAKQLTGTVAFTDFVHGQRGTGTTGAPLHGAATGSVPGFMSASDFTKLSGIAASADVTLTALAAAASNIAVNSKKITTLADPTSAQDAATKNYVDGIVTSLPGAGLTKTGNVLNVIANADASIVVNADDIQVGVVSDTQHGSRGGGSLHSAVIASGASGFMTGADKAKLDGVASGATALSLASTTPAAVGTGAVGVGTTAARADHVHDHGNQAGGSLHALATGSANGFMQSSDFTKLAGVATGADVTTAALAAASSLLTIGGARITGLGTPSSASDATTKAYVDAVASGLDVKVSVRAIATSNITLSGTQTIDGVAVVANDRVLAAGQTSSVNNGIYVVAAGAWSRATDATGANVTAGLFTFVTEGTANADSGWVLTTDDPITVGTSSLVFTQFSGAGQIVAGTGLAKSGNTLNVGANGDGSIVVNADDIQLGVIPPAKVVTALASAASDIAINTHKITGVVDPVNPQDAATKNYVDANGAAAVGSGTGLTKTGNTLNVIANADGSIVVNADDIQLGTIPPAKVVTALASAASDIAINTHKITGVVDPISAQDAATKNYVDNNGAAVVGAGTGLTKTGNTLNVIANADGSIVVNADDIQLGVIPPAKVVTALASAASDIAINTHKITGVVDPTNAQDAATKNYVDNNGVGAVGAGTGLSKTGNTLNVIANADGSIVANAHDLQVGVLATDAQHGTRGGGTVHAAVTQSTNGFMLATDKVIIDAMSSSVKLQCMGVTTTNITNLNGGAPLSVDSNSVVAGSRVLVAGQTTTSLNGIYTVVTPGSGANGTWQRATDADLLAKLSTGVLVYVYTGGTFGATLWVISSAITQYQATQLTFPLSPNSPTNVQVQTAAAGTSKNTAREDHAHNVVTASAVSIGITNSAGTGTSLSRSDHVHAHGAQTDGTLHAVATSSVNGFMLASDFTKLSGIAASADVTLTALAAAASNIAVNSKKITTLADPTSAQDAATKAYVDAAVLGMDLKPPCRLATTSNPGNVNSAAPNIVDSTAVAVNDRILVKDHPGTLNGIWVINSVGAGANGVWTRATDADDSGITTEVSCGMFVFVTAGTSNANTGWLLTTPDPITLGVTTLTFTQMDGPGAMLPGAGLTRSGNTFNVVANADGSIVVNADDIQLGVIPSASVVTALSTIGSNLAVNSRKITLVGDPTSAQDAATKNYIDGIVTSLPGTGLTKTGNVLNVIGNGDGSIFVNADDIQVGIISDTQHGARAGGSLHLAVVASGASGFMTGTDKAKLDGVAAGADVTLTALAAAASNIAVNSKRITSLADPSGAQDAATKNYVDAVATGLDLKASCRVIATSNITLSGTQTIDGVAVIATDRVLVAGQTTAANNGIYAVAAGAWSRATDADSSAEVTSGMFTFVSEGTTNADSGWVLTTDDPITLGTSSLVFTQFSGAGQVVSGAGLTKSGNTLNVVANADGSIVVNADDIQLGVIPPAKVVTALASAASDIAINTHKITGVVDPVSAQDAATKNYVDGIVTSLPGAGLTKTGNVLNVIANADASIVVNADDVQLGVIPPAKVVTALASAASDIAVNTHKITGVVDPVSAQDAATKNYVDGIVTSLPGAGLTKTGNVLNVIANADASIVVNADDIQLGTIPPAKVVTALASAASDIAINTHKITGVVDPVNPQDAATKNYVDTTGAAGVLGGAGLTKTSNTLNVIANADGSIVVNADDIQLGTIPPAKVVTALASAASDIAINTHKITGVVDPVSAQDAATKNYVDGIVTSLPGAGLTKTGNVLNVIANADASIVVNADDIQLGTIPPAKVVTALASAASDIAINTHKITGVVDPVNPQDAATKNYVDAVVTGIDPKTPCRLATTANVTTLGGGAPNTLDSVTLVLNDRILVKNQTTGSQNGVYTVTTVGTGANGTWTRATDADASSEVTSGLFAFVTAGTTQANTGWVLTTPDPITLNTTSLTFAQFSGPGSMIAGNGLSRAGNTFTVQAADGSISVGSGGIQVGVLASDAQHGNRGNGALHSVAVAGGANGFLLGTDKTKLDSLAASQSATLGYVTVDVILETPTAVTFASTLNLDCSIKNDFAIGLLTANLAITFTNPAAGRQGSVWVRQDATGGRTISFAASGFTVVKDSLSVDTNPASAASALTMYSYAMFAVGGTNYLQISKSFLS